MLFVHDTEEGHYTGGIVAFGYKRVKKGRLNKRNQEVCELEVNEEEAVIVRLIFQKYVYEGYGVLWTRRKSNPRPFGCEPNALPAISLLCTPRTPWERKNQRVFVYIKYPAIPTTFLGRKYGLQAADFQDDAVWGVIWLADKWATGPWDVTHMGFRCIASRFERKHDVP